METLNGATVLVGESDPEVRAYLDMALRCLGYSVELAQNGDEVLSCLLAPNRMISAVLLDVRIAQQDGIEILREIRMADQSLPVIMVSGASSIRNIVTAMKHGATDFLCKPFEHEDLRNALKTAIEKDTTRGHSPQVPAPASPSGIFCSKNSKMREIQSRVQHIGWSDITVLIQGETGSGKEVLARELHLNSSRASHIFLKLNCAALPSELLESELFGYERGAFTGAIQKKMGMFEVADGGTLLLDEIGDMDIRLQAKLLHVLQDSEFHRIGGKELIRVNVRLMASTHRDLEKAIVNRCFREDLYYRLNVINIQLPPLRERKEDIIPLAELLLKKHAPFAIRVPVITPSLRDALESYHWPGNIRELENAMRNLIVFRDPDELVTHLQTKAAAHVTASKNGVAPVPVVPSPAGLADRGHVFEQVTKARQQAEAEAILAALNATHWKRKQAAGLLGIDYKALLYKMKKLAITPAQLSAEVVEYRKSPEDDFKTVAKIN